MQQYMTVGGAPKLAIATYSIQKSSGASVESLSAVSVVLRLEFEAEQYTSNICHPAVCNIRSKAIRVHRGVCFGWLRDRHQSRASLGLR